MKYKEDKQHIIHYLFNLMLESGIVNSSTEFSINICGKYKDYYGNSKLKKFDLTLETTINSIYNIKKLKRKYEAQNPKLGYIHTEKITVLEHCEEKLREYLRVKYRVAEIVEEVSTIYDDSDFYGIII